MLAGLAAGIEGARDLGAAEAPICQVAGIFAGKRHALGDALVDNVHADLGEAVDIAFAGAEVAAFDCVVEQPVNAVTVVLVILRGIDPALGGDAVGAPGAVLNAKRFYIVPEFAKGRSGGGAGQAGSHDDDVVFPFVGGVDELGVAAEFVPLLRERTVGNSSVELHVISPSRLKLSPGWKRSR